MLRLALVLVKLIHDSLGRLQLGLTIANVLTLLLHYSLDERLALLVVPQTEDRSRVAATNNRVLIASAFLNNAGIFVT